MAVTFLGYIDNPEEMLQGKRRSIFLCDSETDVSDLPTDEGISLPNGGKTAVPAAGSYAIVAGAGTRVLKSDETWGNLK